MIAKNRLIAYRRKKEASWPVAENDVDSPGEKLHAERVGEATQESTSISPQGAIEILKLKLQIANLSRSQEVLREAVHSPSIIAPITDLGEFGLTLLQEIPAVIQLDAEDSYVATFFDANINASGETQVEAFSNLRHMIASSFRLFIRKQDCLGDGPQAQLDALRRYIAE